jgi:hypothetical protein
MLLKVMPPSATPGDACTLHHYNSTSYSRWMCIVSGSQVESFGNCCDRAGSAATAAHKCYTQSCPTNRGEQGKCGTLKALVGKWFLCLIFSCNASSLLWTVLLQFIYLFIYFSSAETCTAGPVTALQNVPHELWINACETVADMRNDKRMTQ